VTKTTDTKEIQRMFFTYYSVRSPYSRLKR
jgi:hypothetical protein